MELRRHFRVRAIIALATAAQLTAATFGVVAALTPAPAAAVQSVPYKINFQGRLTDNSGNILSDGSYNVKFRIFDAATSGTNLWEADRVRGASDHRISVQNGLFNIQFGDTTQGDPALSPSLFNTQTYSALYLEVELPTPATATCATNGCAGFTEGAMTPRQPLAASPYAFNADALDGLDSSSFVQLSPSGGTQTGNIDISGNMLAAGAVQAATGTFSGAGGVTLGSTANAAALVMKDGTANNRAVTLAVSGLAASYSVTLPTAAPGTSQCLQTSSGSATQLVFDFCSVGGATVALSNLSSVAINSSLLPASANAIDLGSSAKTWRTGYIATSLLTPLVDALSSSTALNIGTTNASVINLNQTTQIKPTSDTTTAFNVKTSLNNNMFTVDTNAARVGIALGGSTTPTLYSSARGLEVSGALRLSNKAYPDNDAWDQFTTPGGSGVPVRLNIPYLDPTGSFGQVIAVGIPNCSLQGDHTANCTAPGSGQVSDTHRGIVVFDERQGSANGRHQPSLGVFSPDEANVAGIGWYNGAALFSTQDINSGGSTAGLTISSGNTQGGSFGNSGDIAIQTGTIAGGTGSTTGALSLLTGNAAGTSASSGAIAIDSGTHTSGGTSGGITIGGTNATSIVLGGNTSTTITEKVANSSTTAYTLQTAGGTNLLVADTSAGKLTVGVADGNATLLVLDTKNTTGDPTAIDGAMYYNSALASFRCARDGAWSNCANNEIDHGYNFEDDFLTGGTATGQIGTLGWTTGGTCTIAYNPTAGPALSHDHPGVVNVSTTANNTVCILRMPTNNTVVAAADDILKFTVAPGEATNVRHEVGLANWATAPASNSAPTSGVWWEANPASNARWQYCYANNGTPTCATNSNATPTITANAWNKFEIRIVSSTAVDFIYNGTKVSLTGITVDLGATNKLTPAISENGLTNATHALYADYFQWRGVVTTSGGR
jgi:hypothetical protein